MSEISDNFHNFALKSSLFKGRSDWYFCFLKGERIAQVLAVLAKHAPEDVVDDFYTLREQAAALPGVIANMVADIATMQEVLALVFSLITQTRLLATRNGITQETTAILINEYQQLAQKLDAGARLSPFVSVSDFAIPLSSSDTLAPMASALSEVHQLQPIIKDKSAEKGQSISKGQQTRQAIILAFIRAKLSVSIKDICQLPDAEIKGCSEKTIQRELADLIRQGLIKKVGERRWSQYVPA